MSDPEERFRLRAVVDLVLENDDEVLLLKRANTGYMDGYYGLVAGHLEGGETALSALIREAGEEAGIAIDPADAELVHTVHKLEAGVSPEQIQLYFRVKKWQGEIVNKEPQKCAGLEWHPLDNLPDKTIPLVREVLKHIREGSPYSEYSGEPI